MIEDGDLPSEKIALYSGLTLEQVLALERKSIIRKTDGST